MATTASLGSTTNAPNLDLRSVRFGGRYRALALVKEGQGISTWHGTDLESGRNVVLKVALRQRGLASVERRLSHEADVLRTIDSPRVVPLLDLGREGDFFYMVMPRVAGETLEQRLRVGRMGLPNALAVTSCVLEALEALHAHGILHRDVKPSNVIVDSAARPTQATLIDAGFSVSEALDDTLRDIPVGTARYMSPEQAGFLDREVAPPSDLYAAGVLMFECLAGQPLFQGESVGDILRHHLVTPPPELRALGHTVPRAVDQIVQRLLRKDRAIVTNRRPALATISTSSARSSKAVSLNRSLSSAPPTCVERTRSRVSSVRWTSLTCSTANSTPLAVATAGWCVSKANPASESPVFSTNGRNVAGTPEPSSCVARA